MGILQSIFKPKTEEIPTCPNCGFVLDKFPGKKTKCVKCGEFMYVRTRPSDRKRVVVTRTQAEKIEEEWAMATGTHDQYLVEKKKVEDEREALKKRFGKEPSENDLQWSLFNKELIENARNNNWGFYRNTRLGMGDLLKKEEKLELALDTYLEICYLDLNGPMNGNLQRFDPTYPTAELAPGIIEYIRKLSKKLEFDISKLKEMFLKTAVQSYKALKLPLKPEDCWEKVEEELKKENL